MTEEVNRPLPEVEGGALNRAPKTVRPLEDIKAEAGASQAQQEQIHKAEQSAEMADRQGQIELFLMENELFGFEPYSPEVLASLSVLLQEKEVSKRESNPDFNITSDWSERKILRYFERKYAGEKKETLAENTETEDSKFVKAISKVKAESPDIDNLALAKALRDNYSSEIPPEHLARLQAFVRIQELAATPEDAAIVTAKINNLNFDNGIPDPVLFVQGQIFNDPNLSDASKDAIATELKIPRPTLVTGSDINKAMDAVDAEGNPKYTEKNPLQVRGGVNAYVKPDGSRVARVEVDGVGIREIPWERNERGEYIGLKLSMLKIWAVNEKRGNTDFFGETVNIDNQILSQTDPEKLRKTQQIMEALLGGDAGYDGEVITDEQAEFVSWFAQYVSTKGDAAEGDFDKQAAIENRTNLGIHPNGDITQIDYEVMREAGSFAQGQYGTGSPDYPALQKHLHEMFPEKDIPLTGENAPEESSEES